MCGCTRYQSLTVLRRCNQQKGDNGVAFNVRNKRAGSLTGQESVVFGVRPDCCALDRSGQLITVSFRKRYCWPRTAILSNCPTSTHRPREVVVYGVPLASGMLSGMGHGFFCGHIPQGVFLGVSAVANCYQYYTRLLLHLDLHGALLKLFTVHEPYHSPNR